MCCLQYLKYRGGPPIAEVQRLQPYCIQNGARNVIPFYHPIKIETSQYRCCKRASECCSSWKMRQMSSVCKMAENGRLTVDQKVKVVLFYAETKSVVATQRCFRAHFGTRWAPCKQTIYSLSLGTIFQSMRINSVPDVKWFCNNKMCYVYNQWYDISCAILYITT